MSRTLQRAGVPSATWSALPDSCQQQKHQGPETTSPSQWERATKRRKDGVEAGGVICQDYSSHCQTGANKGLENKTLSSSY